ncbi:MAG: magnesium transporter [Caulobacterales bacterium]|uniref:magnesium transporter n=1 Tax=Glycocaulis sp. TaxID=1969725 RepID=UPI003F9FEE6F
MAFDEAGMAITIDAEDHPADIAAALSEMDPGEAWKLLCALPVEVQADVFGYIEPDLQAETIEHMTRPQLTALITEMNADDRADVYNRLSEEQQEMILPALAHVERENIRKLASYEDGTAGAIMTSDYATLKPELTAKEAIAQLRREAPDKETIYRTYVLKDDRELIGTVRLTDLILAPPSRKIADLMDDDPVYVGVDDDQESVARTIAKYDILALPVVDAEHHLVGIVTHDDAIDALEEEATEDFLRLGAHGDIDESVRSAGIFTLYRARIVWLILLVFGNLLSGFGIAYFENIIAAQIVLIFFLPLLIASGGNAGAQASTLMVRALATGEVRSRDWGRMLGREFLVAGALGLTMALAVSGIGIFRGGPEIAMVVASSMIIIVLVGSLIGMSLPFVLSRFNLDPAAASAPLVTSIADATGVVIYFTIAGMVLFA